MIAVKGIGALPMTLRVLAALLALTTIYVAEGRSIWEDLKSSCSNSADSCDIEIWKGLSFPGYKMAKSTCNLNDNKVVCEDEVCTWKVASFEDDGYSCVSELGCGNFCKRRVLFSAGELPRDPTKASNVSDKKLISDIVEDIGADLTASFLVKEDILSRTHCAIIKDHTDMMLQEALAKGHDYVEGVHIADDYQDDIEPNVLKNLIGTEAILKLHEGFKEYDDAFPVNRFKVRRLNFNEDAMHMDWHVDGDNAVMHVWLDEENVDGGNYLFLGEDGQSEVETTTGSAMVHGHHVAHAIRSFTGTRYILLLIGDHRKMEDAVLKMKGEESTKLDF